MSREPKMRHCFNCGAELGVYADHDPLDHCGDMDCRSAVREEIAQQQADAHEQLDRDLGFW